LLNVTGSMPVSWGLGCGPGCHDSAMAVRWQLAATHGVAPNELRPALHCTANPHCIALHTPFRGCSCSIAVAVRGGGGIHRKPANVTRYLPFLRFTKSHRLSFANAS